MFRFVSADTSDRGDGSDPLVGFASHLSGLRDMADQLMSQYGAAAGGGGAAVEIYDNLDVLHEVHAGLREQTLTQVRDLSRPPMTGPEVEDDVNSQLAMLGRGISARTVYGAGCFDDSDVARQLRSVIDAGEEARMVPEVPMTVRIFDDTCAMLPYYPSESSSSTEQPHMVVRQSRLLDLIISMFELLWTAATPLPRSDGTGATDPEIDRDVLLYLASGATDSMIARHLNVSPRTAQRRVRALMDALGAQSRFQAGIQAARRHLL